MNKIIRHIFNFEERCKSEMINQLHGLVEIKMKAKFKDGHLQVTQVLLVIKISQTVYKKWSHIAMITVWNIGL